MVKRSRRWTSSEIGSILERLSPAPRAAAVGRPEPSHNTSLETAPIAPPDRNPSSKYHAQRASFRGRTYPSRLQARLSQYLFLRQQAGEIRFYLEEVPFRLPGGSTHRIDALVFYPAGGFELIEAKGRDLPMGKLKRRQVEELYGVAITLWTAASAKGCGV